MIDQDGKLTADAEKMLKAMLEQGNTQQLDTFTQNYMQEMLMPRQDTEAQMRELVAQQMLNNGDFEGAYKALQGGNIESLLGEASNTSAVTSTIDQKRFAEIESLLGGNADDINKARQLEGIDAKAYEKLLLEREKDDVGMGIFDKQGRDAAKRAFNEADGFWDKFKVGFKSVDKLAKKQREADFFNRLGY